MCLNDRLHQTVQTMAGLRRHNCNADALDLRQQAIDRISQAAYRAGFCGDQVPFVHRDHDRAAFPLDQIGDADVLFFEWSLSIDQHDYDLSETDRVECIGDGKLLQLLVYARAATQAGSVVNAKMSPAPIELYRHGVARDASLRAR